MHKKEIKGHLEKYNTQKRVKKSLKEIHYQKAYNFV